MRVLIFLLVNFLALLIGGLFTGDGVSSDWYQELNKAPWTPPGWVFGAAWTSIMICYAFYMSALWNKSVQEERRTLLVLYSIQWMLNVSWNPIFFYFHQAGFGLVVIVALTLIIALFLFRYFSKNKLFTLLLVPYFIWLLIATSLNAYIYVYN